MRLVFVLCIFFYHGVLAAQSFSVVSWNIQDMGRTKDDQEIAFIADIVKDYDLVCIQEVVAGDPAGAQAVSRLGELLKTKGAKWEYRISDPTGDESPYKKERYAFLWKPSKLELIGRPALDKALDEAITREPYIAQFRLPQGTAFYVVNFHSIPHNQNPQEEIQEFQHYPERLGSDRILIAGDFNTTEEDAVFDLLYNKGFRNAVSNSPSTLKRKCTVSGAYLNYAIDNIYFSKGIDLQSAAAIDFVGECSRLEIARRVSDHLPVLGQFTIRE